MDIVITTAIAKELTKRSGAKAARATLAAGTYDLDEVVEVRIKGTLKVGEDYEKASTHKVPLIPTLAVALHHAGVTGDAALAAIEKAMEAALKKDLPASMPTTKAIEAVEAKVRERFGKMKKSVSKGPVVFEGSAGVVVDIPTAAE